MLIICDFDGTVSARDTNSHLSRRFAPDVSKSLEGRLAARELSVREVLQAEFEHITATLDEVVSVACTIPLRDGFVEFLDAADDGGHDVVLLSSGFRQIIEPMLERGGAARRVPLIANDIEFTGAGANITWRELPACDVCGEACKRYEVEGMRREVGAGGRRPDVVVFVGDGFSDRCGADVADRIFARDSLARWLDDHSVAWEAWDDFFDVSRALGLTHS
ncbi:MAG: mtnX [Thermoleophilia bacterium]|nr:mtnX [Thermoleophilia bacterium]